MNDDKERILNILIKYNETDNEFAKEIIKYYENNIYNIVEVLNDLYCKYTDKYRMAIEKEKLGLDRAREIKVYNEFRDMLIGKMKEISAIKLR